MAGALTLASSRCVLFALAAVIPVVVAASDPTVRPESAGVSSERLQRVSELVDRYIASGDISGAVTLVARNGRIVHLKAQGVADIASRKPMQEDTIFRIASMSKPVAGVSILMLVEEGKVRLTDPVSRFIPAFSNMKVAVVKPPRQGTGLTAGPPAPPPAAVVAVPDHYLVPAEREITVLDLLTHTSGLMSGPISNAAGGKASQTRHSAGLKWVEGLAAGPLEFQPGTRWAYSALAGFDVLSRIVEIASGKTFNEFTRDRIFLPLGAREITFWPTPAQRARVVTSYLRSDKGLTPRDNPDSMSGQAYFSGAGGFQATADSYARFAMMLANRGELHGVRILSPRMAELMGSLYISDTLPGRPAGEGYGLSVRVVSDPPARRTTLSKGSFGWSGAYGTHFFVDPSKNLVGVLMIQTPIIRMREDFENAVMQAVLD